MDDKVGNTDPSGSVLSGKLAKVENTSEVESQNEASILKYALTAKPNEVVVSMITLLVTSPMQWLFLYAIFIGADMPGKPGHGRVHIDPYSPLIIGFYLFWNLPLLRDWLTTLAIPPRLFVFLIIKPIWAVLKWTFKLVWRLTQKIGKTKWSVEHLKSAVLIFALAVVGLFKLVWLALGNPIGIVIVAGLFFWLLWSLI